MEASTRHPLSIGEKGQRSYYSLARVRAYILASGLVFVSPFGSNRIPLPSQKNLTEEEARVVGCGGPQTVRVLSPEEHTCRAAEMKK